jgi:hypothetical protein
MTPAMSIGVIANPSRLCGRTLGAARMFAVRVGGVDRSSPGRGVWSDCGFQPCLENVGGFAGTSGQACELDSARRGGYDGITLGQNTAERFRWASVG